MSEKTSVVSSDRHFTVAQLGARMHYAVPEILERAGILAAFHTDVAFASATMRKVIQLAGRRVENRMERRFIGIPHTKLFNHRLLALSYFGARRVARSDEEMTRAYLSAGKSFAASVGRNLRGNAVYGFNSASLELFRAARDRGMRIFLEQTIAPKEIEVRILDEESIRWLGRPRLSDVYTARYIERERDEWQLADVIVCGSQFVVQAIAAAGGPVEKAVVCPYGVSVDREPVEKLRRPGPLRVLFAGEVGLRKGAPYLMAAARLLVGEVIVHCAGMQSLPPGVAEVPPNVVMLGHLDRAGIQHEFEWADVFCLPSLCEGSSTMTYEALAAGLPVVTTPNAGSIVTNGEDGLVVPIRQIPQLAAALSLLSSRREILASMQAAAWKKARLLGSLEAYEHRLVGLLQTA